jgi:DNA-binding NarL/FixJ family response regulator
MGNPLRVNVVALDPMLQAGAESALGDCPDVVVVPPREAAAVTVVITDALADQVLETLRALRDEPHRPQVVLVAADLEPDEALYALAAGARGLLRRRELGASGLARAVLAAAEGDCTVPPDILARLLGRGAPDPAPAGSSWPGPLLNERERAVLELIADGHETDEIARELSYSIRTVTGVVHDITHRFRLRNRAHAVAYALRTGLL